MKMANLKMLIDMKQTRIRIHKSTLRALGNPRWLSLVINPEECTLGITPGSPDDKTAHRVSSLVYRTKDSCELHSAVLIRALLDLCPGWHCRGKYSITGSLIPEANMVRFDMNTAVFEETDDREPCSGQTTR